MFSNGFGLEAIGQYEKDVFVGAMRMYLYPHFMQSAQVRPFIAVEADYSYFKGEYSKGYGYGGGAFAGLEYFLGKRFSMQLDGGMLYLQVKDRATSLRESGIEYLMNVGINIYILRGHS